MNPVILVNAPNALAYCFYSMKLNEKAGKKDKTYVEARNAADRLIDLFDENETEKLYYSVENMARTIADAAENAETGVNMALFAMMRESFHAVLPMLPAKRIRLKLHPTENAFHAENFPNDEAAGDFEIVATIGYGQNVGKLEVWQGASFEDVCETITEFLFGTEKVPGSLQNIYLWRGSVMLGFFSIPENYTP